MPSLAELTDQYPQQQGNTLPVEQPYRGVNLGPLQGNTTNPIGNTTEVVPAPTADVVAQANPNSVGTSSSGSQIIDKLLGLGGQERYQLWPEKVAREALAAPHDAMTEGLAAPGLRREDYTDIPAPTMPTKDSTWLGRVLNVAPVAASPADAAISQAQSMSALAGTGGLAGAGEEAGAALGAGPFLRPALKYEGKIYKAPMGGQHLDALPDHLYNDFQQKAISGEDINHYNFGFMNHKGQFLDREKALDYGIKEGLIDPSAGQYGALTSTLLADSSKPGTAIEAMAKTGQPFYSALEHNVNAINQPKMTGDQWLGTLANKPGVKPEELDWTGVKSFLQEKGNQPVTKAELQEHLQNNKVELKEVDKGAPPSWDKLSSAEQYAFLDKYKDQGANNSNIRDIYEETMADEENHPTKYHSYQLAGGENYREKLLTLPPIENKLPQFKVIRPDGHVESTWANQEGADKWAKHIGGTVREDKPVIVQGGYKSSHWDEPNILAHVRMNDRMIDGKKSLHLEEIQSDWHQQGRDKGYETERKAAMSKVQDLIKEASTLSPNDARYKEIYKELPQWQSKANERAVPDAPFKKSWHELALKRMIREAAESSQKSEVANWDKMVQSKPDELAHKLVASGHLKEICD